MSKFAKAAASYAAIVSNAAANDEEKILAFSQVLGGALYINGQDWSDQQKAEFLAEIVKTVLINMPELEYEFGLAMEKSK